MRKLLVRAWAVLAVAAILVATPGFQLAPTRPADSPIDAERGERVANLPAPGSHAVIAPVLEPLELTLCPGDTHIFDYPVSLRPTPLQADILFAFDTTYSMHAIIDDVGARASDMLAALEGLIDDVRFGVVDFRDYPLFPYGNETDWSYWLRQPLTSDEPAVQRIIDQLEADGGLDAPESYTRVLYESCSDPNIDWRRETRRFVIMFGNDVPHDDDLNAGIPNPPKSGTWETNPYPPHLDPGRDGENGTDDDLDFQPVLAELRERAITLLFVVGQVSAMREADLTTAELVYYWQRWAGLTGPGGDAVVLEQTEDLPQLIRHLVASAVRHIMRLALVVEPEDFASWVTFEPPAFTDFTVPSQGITKTFHVTLTVPPDAGPGEYEFLLRAVADGTTYAAQPVRVVVPGVCFVTPTPTPVPLPTPRPRWNVYLPLMARDLW